MTKILSQSEDDTITIARDLAAEIKPRDVLFLHGTLGMGKTVFARALIRELCGDETLEVVSPTFTLVQTYEARDCDVHHYDLYRIEDADEIFALGWEDSLNEAITIVEWPERLGPYQPASRLDITLANADNDKDHREILIMKIPPP